MGNAYILVGELIILYCVCPHTFTSKMQLEAEHTRRPKKRTGFFCEMHVDWSPYITLYVCRQKDSKYGGQLE